MADSRGKRREPERSEKRDHPNSSDGSKRARPQDGRPELPEKLQGRITWQDARPPAEERWQPPELPEEGSRQESSRQGRHAERPNGEGRGHDQKQAPGQPSSRAGAEKRSVASAGGEKSRRRIEYNLEPSAAAAASADATAPRRSRKYTDDAALDGNRQAQQQQHQRQQDKERDRHRSSSLRAEQPESRAAKDPRGGHRDAAEAAACTPPRRAGDRNDGQRVREDSNSRQRASTQLTYHEPGRHASNSNRGSSRDRGGHRGDTDVPAVHGRPEREGGHARALELPSPPQAQRQQQQQQPVRRPSDEERSSSQGRHSVLPAAPAYGAASPPKDPRRAAAQRHNVQTADNPYVQDLAPAASPLRAPQQAAAAANYHGQQQQQQYPQQPQESWQQQSQQQPAVGLPPPPLLPTKPASGPETPAQRKRREHKAALVKRQVVVAPVSELMARPDVYKRYTQVAHKDAWVLEGPQGVAARMSADKATLANQYMAAALPGENAGVAPMAVDGAEVHMRGLQRCIDQYSAGSSAVNCRTTENGSTLLLPADLLDVLG